MLYTTTSSGGPRSHAAPSRGTKPHMNLEAIVALHGVLSDVGAGAQVNLAIQLIGLQQEGHG